jgi:hypothetical protein
LNAPQLCLVCLVSARQELTMPSNRKLKRTDRHGHLNETTERLLKLELWLGFGRPLLWMLLLLCIR